MDIYKELITPNSKTPYALWFEYYRLCLNDKQCLSYIEKSKEFYKPWGDVRHISFYDWWKTHKHLFDEQEVKEVHQISKIPGTITLQIPLGIPSSTSLVQVKQFIEERQRQRLVELGLDSKDRKSLKVGFARYVLSGISEFRADVQVDTYFVYRFWLAAERPRIGQEFCNFVYGMYMALKGLRRSLHFLPTVRRGLHTEEIVFTDEQLRQLKRCVDRGKSIIRSVANGQFPGNMQGTL